MAINNNKKKNLWTISAGEGMKKREPSYIVDAAIMENSKEFP